MQKTTQSQVHAQNEEETWQTWQRTVLVWFYCSMGASMTTVSQLLKVQSTILWINLYRQVSVLNINKSCSRLVAMNIQTRLIQK